MSRREGVITKAFGTCYQVIADQREWTCTLRGKFRTTSAKSSYTDPVVVGDRVLITCDSDGTGSIDELIPRNNLFSRKEKGRYRNEDIIASNVDIIVIIQAFHRPKLNLRFADRVIVRAIKEKIEVLVCVNKLDIALQGQCDAISAYYRGSGVPVMFVSAHAGDGMKELREFIRARVSLFIGNSGAGKSSILNNLIPDLDLHTIEISEKTGKGRHATTNATMVRMDDTSHIIDTPGLREFGLLDIEPNDLARYFMEFNCYRDACSFRPCTHDHEPRCAVRERVEQGSIDFERYVSYLNILASLREFQSIRYG